MIEIMRVEIAVTFSIKYLAFELMDGAMVSGISIAAGASSASSSKGKALPLFPLLLPGVAIPSLVGAGTLLTPTF